MLISALPTPPTRSNPESFAARGDAFLAALPGFVTQANALRDEVSAFQAMVVTNAAQVQAAAYFSSYKGVWATLSGALNIPAVVFHNGDYWNLIANTANVTSIVPGVSGQWTLLNTGAITGTFAALVAGNGTAAAPSFKRTGGVAGVALTSSDQVGLVSVGLGGGDVPGFTLLAQNGININSWSAGTTDAASVWGIGPTVKSTNMGANQYGLLWSPSYEATVVPSTFWGAFLRNSFIAPSGTLANFIGCESVPAIASANLCDITTIERYRASDVANAGHGKVNNNFGLNAPVDWNEGVSLIALVNSAINDIPGSAAISSISRTANVVTATTSAANQLSNGQAVVVAGVTDSGFNGTFTVTSIIDSTHFTYAQTAANASSSGGTATGSGLSKYGLRMAGTAPNLFSGFVLQKRAQIDQSYTYQAPTTGFSLTIGDTVGSLLLNPAGTLAAGTVAMPANPTDGQIVRVSSTQAITALTMSGNGKTLNGALTTIAANGFASWQYRVGGTMWHRIG